MPYHEIKDTFNFIFDHLSGENSETLSVSQCILERLKIISQVMDDQGNIFSYGRKIN